MKRTVLRDFTFVATIVIGVLGTPLTTVRRAASLRTEAGGQKLLASTDFASVALATATMGPPKLDPKQLLSKSMVNSALSSDRERVEVLARNITFPEVLNQGELMTRVEYPNSRILCLDAALYAGRVEGLILAMDRDTVLEHRLQWVIDAADDLFNSCLEVFLLEAFTGQIENDRNQRKEFIEEIAEQIRMIQKALRYARDVKFKEDARKFG